MLLHDLNQNALSFQIKSRIANSVLAESITDFFSITISRLKNKPIDEVFHGREAVDLERLSKIITALKVLSNKDYREVITKDDIGINPNSAKELFTFLANVRKDGDSEKEVEYIFNALKLMAPSTYRKELEKLEKLKSRDRSERQEAIQSLEVLATKVSQMFQKLKGITTAAKAAGVPSTQKSAQTAAATKPVDAAIPA